MDLCVEIVIVAQPGGDETYNPGDFVNIYPADQMGVWDGSKYTRDSVGMPKTGLVFVTGVPIDVFNKPLEQIREKLCRTDGVRKRPWRAILADIPLAIRNQFLTDKYITFTWAQVKNYTRNKVGELNLTDGDLSG